MDERRDVGYRLTSKRRAQVNIQCLRVWLAAQGVYHVSLPAEVRFPVNRPFMIAIHAEFLIDQVPYTRFRLHIHHYTGP